MATNPKQQMTVEEFLKSYEGASGGRYELVEGEVILMSPERARHNLTKLAVARALHDAVAQAGLQCTVFTDGIGIRTGDDTVREPDASVQWGADVDQDSMLADKPVVVVEVVSPSSERTDAVQKLMEYFSVASIFHYLIVHAEKRTLIHHARGDDGEIRTRILGEGVVDLSPPGFSVTVEQLLGDR